MKVIIASDHAGFDYKNVLLKNIQQEGYDVIDIGTFSKEPDDYPDRAADIANAIINNKGQRGIIICGSGVGVSVAANKFKGIRAGVCHDTYSAHQCVEHDNVNVICLGERVIGIELAREIIFTFLKAAFTHAPRHQKRLNKISDIENENMK
jgi:ribose 5-phosphate isomerase B